MKEINEAFNLFEQSEFEKAEAIYLTCLEKQATGGWNLGESEAIPLSSTTFTVPF